ncbi:MAG TPA: long-chain fatty acid--CoA ligase [Candidatus Latescibacteria bacterium]|nr:long-chain fatty acid--CoA ligase [Candidatus Latescibacterota bacterium]
MHDYAVTTLGRLFLNACRTHRKPDRMMVKKDGAWKAISTAEFETTVRRLSLGFQALGLKPGDRVALLSENRPEWVMADFATLTAGGVTVPIYTSLLPDQIRYIVDDAGATIVVCSDRDLLRKVEAVRGALPSVEHIVLLEGEAPKGALSFADVLDRGKRLDETSPGAFERSAEAARPGDLASIIYTSGTTGLPKGVMLSHANFVSNIDSLRAVIDFRADDTILSFLPLSHVLERTATFLFVHSGSAIAYAESVEAVAPNMVEVRPTIVVSVPRLFEKIYARVMDQILAGSRLKRAIFVWALATGKKYAARVIAHEPVPKHLALKRGLAEKLVYSKITSKTGGRMRFFVCGGAPLSKDIAEFFYAMGLIVLPGYGLTETSPVLTANTLNDYRFDTVGKTVPGVELRIAADGEILARGPNVMMGYYKNETDTREVMKGGWLHTGDIGRFDADGFLTITDRKKDIIVTSGGKNIAPQPIESLIQSSPYIANAVVLGSTRRFISALIVPDFDKLESRARDQGVPFKDRAELCRRTELIDFLLDEVSRVTPELAPYERVKRIAVLDRDFDMGLDEVTPTLKVKRNIVEQKYAELIEAMYRD